MCSQCPHLIRLWIPYSLMLADSSIVFTFWVCDYLESYSIILFIPLVEDEAKKREKWILKWGGACLQRLRMAKAMLIQLILWGLCAGLKCGVKTDHLIEFIDLLGDFSHEPGTRQLQCNPKRSYWAPKENIPLAKSVGASVNIGDKQQGQQRQE